MPCLISRLAGFNPGKNDHNADKRHGEGRQDGPHIRMWKRCETENHFITPELPLTWADRHLPHEDLFAQARRKPLDEPILKDVFDGKQKDFANHQKAGFSSRKMIWRALALTEKLSLFA